MSDEDDIKDAFGDVLEDEELGEEEVEQGEETEEAEPEAPKGFMTKEAWVAAGKDPEEWTPPEVYKERRQRINDVSKLKRELKEREQEFENQVKNIKMYASAQLERQRRELMGRRDDAIDVADRKAVTAIEKEIADLDRERELVAEQEVIKQSKPVEVAEWEEENPWCQNPEDPRLPVAQQAYIEAKKAGGSDAKALRAADKAVAAMSSSRQDKKPPVQMSDSSTSIASSRDTAGLSWSQLNGEERTFYEEFFEPSGVSKKDYLKTVALQRKG